MASSSFIHPVVSQLIDLYQPIRDAQAKDVLIREQLAAFAAHLHQAHQDRNPACVPEINNWYPQLVSKSEEEVFAYPFSLADAQLTIARQFGFENWEGVERWEERLDPVFEATVDALMNGKEEVAMSMIESYPDLLAARSAYPHRASLLLYLGTNGVETWRQMVPPTILSSLRYLLEKGADPQAKMNVYGGRFSTKELVATSGHTWEAGVAEEMIAMLEKAGG